MNTYINQTTLHDRDIQRMFHNIGVENTSDLIKVMKMAMMKEGLMRWNNDEHDAAQVRLSDIIITRKETRMFIQQHFYLKTPVISCL